GPAGDPEPRRRPRVGRLRSLARRHALIVFAACAALVQLATAAMLPLMAGAVTVRAGQYATVLVAASVVVPQLVVAALSPWIGRRAQEWGRRPVLLLGFSMVPLRGVLLAVVHDPFWLVAVQILDGITASVFAVMVPLGGGDVSRGPGRFKLSFGPLRLGRGTRASAGT